MYIVLVVCAPLTIIVGPDSERRRFFQSLCVAKYVYNNLKFERQSLSGNVPALRAAALAAVRHLIA